MNYFEYHGAAFWDDERLNMLKNATFCQDIMKITMYEPKVNSALDKSHSDYYTGEFVSSNVTNSWHFVYQNKLYYFSTEMYGRISYFAELPKKEECLAGKAGCFYEFELLTN
jgi:hypothetical protein